MFIVFRQTVFRQIRKNFLLSRTLIKAEVVLNLNQAFHWIIDCLQPCGSKIFPITDSATAC